MRRSFPRIVATRGEYRSGLRGYSQPLGLGGHGFSIIDPPDGFDDDPESFPETPMLLMCHGCFLIVADFELREGFYPRPCTGMMRLVGSLPAVSPGLGDLIRDGLISHDEARRRLGLDAELVP